MKILWSSCASFTYSNILLNYLKLIVWRVDICYVIQQYIDNNRQ